MYCMSANRTLFGSGTFRHFRLLQQRAVRLSSSAAPAAPRDPLAYAFDVDGVLIKGNKALPQGRAALEFVHGANPTGRRLPYILLTNGGGVTEQEKAQQLSTLMGIEIAPESMVLSHSPMRSLADRYADQLVLIVGGEGDACKRVAHQYGFRRVAQPNDVYRWNPSAWPFKTTPTPLCDERIDFGRESIRAVMVFHDGRDWGTELQIVMDALQSRDGVMGTMRAAGDTSSQMPLYFANPDLLWSNDFPVPRFGQGAFRVALEAIYQASIAAQNAIHRRRITGKPLEYTLFGKPELVTYQHAERQLERECKRLGLSTSGLRVYAVGDNPASDIAGANAYGWQSILVRTGVFQGADDAAPHSASYIADHVDEAVRWAFQQEQPVKR